MSPRALVEMLLAWRHAGPGRTQADAARRMGVDVWTVNAWENYRRLPRRGTSVQAILALTAGELGQPYELAH